MSIQNPSSMICRAACFLAVTAVFVAASSAQVTLSGIQGEIADKWHQTYAIAIEDPEKNGGMIIPQAEVGLYLEGQPNHPAERMDIYWGALGAIIPALSPTAFGYSVKPLYSDSPLSAFEDWGPAFLRPTPLDPALDIDPSQPQWKHLPDSELYRWIGGNPFSAASWLTQGAILPGAGAGIVDFGGGPTIVAKTAAKLAQLPPTSPTGGTMTGVILVLQTSVLDTNLSAPMAPVLNLSNAIGLRAMVGPPIDIDFPLGNHGPRLGRIFFTGKNILPGMTVNVQTPGGAMIAVPVRMSDGSNFSIALPPNAGSSPITMSATTGEVEFAEPDPIIVVTHTVPVPITTPGQIPPLTPNDTDAPTEWTLSVIGTAPELAEDLFTLMLPPDYESYDIDFEIYPFDPVRNRAGLGNSVAMTVDLGMANVLPPAGGNSNDAVYDSQTPIQQVILGSSGRFVSTTFTGISEAAVAVEADSTMMGEDFEFLANIRVRAVLP